MIPQQRKEERQPDKPPVHEPPTVNTSAQSPQPAPPSRRRGSARLLLGVALPLVAGSMVWWPWGVPDIFDSGEVLLTVVLSMVLGTAIGAWLLGLRLPGAWGALLAPLAWIVGEVLAAVFVPLLEGGWPALQAQEHFWDAQAVIIQLALLPLLVCAGVGATGALILGAVVKRKASP